MPEICRFYGIIIFMNYNDHNPPHFHARYQEQEIIVEIQTGNIEGKMSQRALTMIFEWTDKYRNELLENWELTKQRKSLKNIPPLH
ncbi:MAG: DUF4160 domain-containing protein [Bacteroidota bacterium]|jgi:hypothetical protein|nr:DUF4160 domain-containing protein [Ignavibacteria bacterium]MCU7497803.1 DUF4160 domain-containing protein [Ignavibacteria bacterium]MCU7511084.1 DUF4160 domain-containing protein [Ignavibacteria bacterium]MCU7518631.1 DUF4160 domain-containing protein [Ignavibacteria bacterium]MCU7522966.1 DUF4160 domain-containing protein [Ignavibacteria bacterium]